MSADKKINKELYPNGIPTELPSNVTLGDVIKSMPKQVFEKDMLLAWEAVFITIFSVVLSIYLVHISPWYLLPFAWAFAGTAATGFFVIGHDCGHLSFARSKWLNDAVGIAAFLPLFYPFEPWRIQHNLHHNNTNKLHVDNAWQPFQPSYYLEASPVEQFIMRVIKGPLWWLASVGHMIKQHFDPSSFTPEQRPAVRVSLFFVYAAAIVFFPSLFYYGVVSSGSLIGGFAAIGKYWLMPWIGFHFWMSTFTMVHHTLPHIPFLSECEGWTEVKSRLCMTVHCEYNYLIERLTHHINVHIPHHVSTAIPHYRLRMAHEALMSKWGKHMHTTTFGIPLILDIIKNCHLYHHDPYTAYQPFSTEPEMPPKEKNNKNIPVHHPATAN